MHCVCVYMRFVYEIDLSECALKRKRGTKCLRQFEKITVFFLTLYASPKMNANPQCIEHDECTIFSCSKTNHRHYSNKYRNVNRCIGSSSFPFLAHSK